VYQCICIYLCICVLNLSELKKMYKYVNSWTYEYMYICTHIYMYICVYIDLYLYICIYVCTCTYTINTKETNEQIMIYVHIFLYLTGVITSSLPTNHISLSLRISLSHAMWWFDQPKPKTRTQNKQTNREENKYSFALATDQFGN